MTSEERQARIDELFQQAIDLPSDDRVRFLERECTDDEAEIRREVERTAEGSRAGRS